MQLAKPTRSSASRAYALSNVMQIIDAQKYADDSDAVTVPNS
jgi:hypothetical protein